jgi:tetrahydromethanopterin S-methyltransferase subunit A
MEDEEIQAKQSLLQTEIIEKNYDKTAFINFCLSKKENGDDLNNWTLDELTEIVREFVNSQTQSQADTGTGEVKQDGQQEIKKEDIEKMEKFNAEESKNFKERVIECRKLDKTQLNDNKLVITVRNPKEMEGGVFGKNYVLYEVQTDPFGWVVLRRFSDFDTLRKLIGKHFPSFYVPPLPNKKMGNRRFDDDFIAKRMKFLNLFINNLVQSETFKSSELLVAFLSYQDRGKFESKVKEYSTQQPSAYVEEYKTLDGKVTISHDEGNEKYFTNISKYFRLQGQILERLNFSLKMFFNNMNQVAESLQDVQKNFEIMHVLNTRVLMKQTITKSYEEMSCFFKNYRKILIKQNEMVKNHMKDFFKYINLEGKAYTELIERREELKAKYTAENQKLTAKKEKLYATGDISKFDLGDGRGVDKDRALHDKPYAFEHMCKADTSNLQKIYNQLGYANKMNMRELKKMIKEYCVRYVDNVKKFDEEFYPSINDLVGTWSNMETFVMSANLPKK